MLFFFALARSISYRFNLSLKESVDLRRSLLEGFTECPLPQAVFGIQRLLELGEFQGRGEKGKFWNFYSVLGLFQYIFESSGAKLPLLQLKTFKVEISLDNFSIYIDNKGILDKQDLLNKIFAGSDSSSIDCECRSDFTAESKFNSKFGRKIKCFACQWSKSLILVILSQIGISEVNKNQFLLIKELLSLPCSTGALGGTGKNAYYFIGHLEPDLLVYIDPHMVQNSVESLTKKDLPTYEAKDLMSVKYSSLSTSFAPSFAVHSYDQFEFLLGSLRDLERRYRDDYFLSGVADEAKINGAPPLEGTMSIITFS